MHILAFFALLAVPLVVQAQSCPMPLSVGFKVTQVAGVKTGIWYPTTGKEAAHTYAGRSPVTGSVALNASAATCARFPLVVFSHGFSGCGAQSLALTEELARRGYVVAAPDHKDAGCSVDGSSEGGFSRPEEPFRNPEEWTDETYGNRRDDIKGLISGLLSHPDFGGAIDADRIGGMGHSLGGYTMFGLAGAWPSWKEPRMKAVLLLSPYIDPFLVTSKFPRFPQLNIPVMFQGGTTDAGITPAIERAGGAYDSSAAPKFFAEFTGGHLLWSNGSCSEKTIAQCVATNPVVASVNNTGFDFLDRYLKGAERPNLLTRTTSGARPAYRRNIKATMVSSANYMARLSTLSIGSLFGEGLSDTTISATLLPLPEQLNGIRVSVRDAQGTSFNAPLFFVSKSQINFLVPNGVAPGTATVTVTGGGDSIASGIIEVGTIAPALFSINQSGGGAPAGFTLTVRPDGTRAFGALFGSDLSPAAIDVNAGAVYLDLYGTGLRNGAAASSSATIGGRSVPVFGIAPSAQYPGLDQIALGPLPASLAGAGTVELEVTVNGERANKLTVLVK